MIKQYISKLQYLYGDTVDTSLWSTMNYKDVLEEKALLAYNLIGELHKEHYTTRDYIRVNECARAITFNETLLKELSYETK
jgi:hypothetical protein